MRRRIAAAVLASLSATAALLGPTSVAAAAPSLQPAATVLSSWYSGTLNPGSSREWWWNNASSTDVYQVGLSPTGASTATPCQFQVTRTWNVQKYGGELEFHFIVKNIGGIACGTQIILSNMSNFSAGAIGGIDAGATVSRVVYLGRELRPRDPLGRHQ